MNCWEPQFDSIIIVIYLPSGSYGIVNYYPVSSLFSPPMTSFNSSIKLSISFTLERGTLLDYYFCCFLNDGFGSGGVICFGLDLGA